jgi:hypothetical protein
LADLPRWVISGADHLGLLYRWRDEAVRAGKKIYGGNVSYMGRRKRLISARTTITENNRIFRPSSRP